MSAHHLRPGPQPRRTAHPAITTAVAAIILLAFAACATTINPGPTWAAGRPGSNGHTSILTGSGSTFVAPFFAVAFASHI